MREKYSIAKEYVFGRLENELPESLKFHNTEHTREVLDAIGRLATMENISREDLFLLKTGGLYHDTGFLEQYKENEPIGARIAGETLPDFGYSDEQIETVSNIILATQLPQNPETPLEEIMCDADLGHLGREDFYVKTEQLRWELAERGIEITPLDWHKENLRLFREHNYFTQAARQLRQDSKEKHFRETKKLVGGR